MQRLADSNAIRIDSGAEWDFVRACVVVRHAIEDTNADAMTAFGYIFFVHSIDEMKQILQTI